MISVGCGFGHFFGLVFRELLERSAVFAQRSGCEEIVMRRHDEIGGGSGCRRAGRCREFRMDIIAGKEIHTIESVTGNQTSDFVECGERIEGAQFGFEAVGLEPDGVAVSLAGLDSAGLAEIGSGTCSAERNERFDASTHRFGEADEDFKVGFDARAVNCLADKLDISESVGDGAGFFVEAGRRENDVGECGGFSEEEDPARR